MRNVNCIVQDGQIADTLVPRLEAGLASIVKSFFGDGIEVNWTHVAKGSGFTGGVPSSSSLVSLGVPQDITQERRVELLSALCEMWAETTDCHVNEVVATAVNGE